MWWIGCFVFAGVVMDLTFTLLFWGQCLYKGSWVDRLIQDKIPTAKSLKKSQASFFKPRFSSNVCTFSSPHSINFSNFTCFLSDPWNSIVLISWALNIHECSPSLLNGPSKKVFRLIGNAIGAITEHNLLFQDWMLETAIFLQLVSVQSYDIRNGSWEVTNGLQNTA